MLGMIVAAAAPSGLAFLLRWRNATSEFVRCDYLFHGNSSQTELLHGTIQDQLIYTDSHPFEKGVIINKTAEFCVSGAGNFCYEVAFLRSLAML
jgi:hypothetical protein